MGVKFQRQIGPNGLRVAFKCPGCGDWHSLPVEGAERPQWGWNGSLENPTLSPSILTRSGHFAALYDGAVHGPCWCEYNKLHPEDEFPFTCYICHSFVRDGQIQFLDDCTHPLKGQTVPLPDVDTEGSCNAD